MPGLSDTRRDGPPLSVYLASVQNPKGAARKGDQTGSEIDQHIASEPQSLSAPVPICERYTAFPTRARTQSVKSGFIITRRLLMATPVGLLYIRPQCRTRIYQMQLFRPRTNDEQ